MPRTAELPTVLDTVLTYGAQERDQHDIALLSHTSDSTVSKACRERLGAHGPLLTGTPVRFGAELGLVLAMSLGSESARAGLVDANGKIHYAHSADAERDQLALHPDLLLARVREQAARVLDDAFREGDLLRQDGTLPLLTAALALPAPVDRDHRLRGLALTHPDWGQRDPARMKRTTETLNDRLARALGEPFTGATAQVMNDCNAAVVAVAFERVRELDPPHEDAKAAKAKRRERTTALLLRVSGGIGAGMIEIAGDKDPIHVSRFLKSRVMVGTNGLAGEIGHLPVSFSAVERINAASAEFDLEPIDYDTRCSCTRPHHLQALAGWHQLARRLRLPVETSPEPMTEMLDPYLNPDEGEQDQDAARALKDAGRLIGRALNGPALTLDPHALTVIGALSVRDLVEGLQDARGDWEKAFWTGRKVAFDRPLHGSTFMALRGAGLVIVRARRHRKLRKIGAGEWGDVEPLLPYTREHFIALAERSNDR